MHRIVALRADSAGSGLPRAGESARPGELPVEERQLVGIADDEDAGDGTVRDAQHEDAVELTSDADHERRLLVHFRDVPGDLRCELGGVRGSMKADQPRMTQNGRAWSLT